MALARFCSCISLSLSSFATPIVLSPDSSRSSILSRRCTCVPVRATPNESESAEREKVGRRANSVGRAIFFPFPLPSSLFFLPYTVAMSRSRNPRNAIHSKRVTSVVFVARSALERQWPSKYSALLDSWRPGCGTGAVG